MELNNKKIKVLFIPSWFPTKENPVKGVFIKNHALVLSKYVTLYVLYVSDSDKIAKCSVTKTEDNGIKILNVFFPYKKNRKNFFNKLSYFKNWFFACNKGYKIIKKEWGKPHVLHAHVIYPAGVYAFYRNLLEKIPFALTEHFDYFLRVFLGFEKMNKMALFINKFLIKKASFTTVCSQKMKEVFDFYGMNQKVFVVPNVIIPPEIKGSEKFNQVNYEGVNLIHISTLTDYQKNITGIIEAVNLLVNQRKLFDLKMHFVGSGKELPNHKKLAKKLNLLDKNVFFHGYLPETEKIGLLKRADALIIFSNFEGFSIVTAEAIYFGTPVIVTRCGGPEEFVNENNGLVIPPNDVNALVDAIEKVIQNKNNYDKLSMKKYILNKFGPEIISSKFLKLYQRYVFNDF